MNSPMTRFIATLGRHRSQAVQALVLAIAILLALEAIGVFLRTATNPIVLAVGVVLALIVPFARSAR